MTAFTQEYIDENRTRMFVCFGVNTVAGIVGVLLVVKASPKHMGVYKYFLLNIVLWSYLMDFVTTLLWMPLPAMPAPSICISGLMKDLGNYNGNSLCFVIFIFAFGGCGAACNVAIIFRLFAMRAQNLDVFTKKPILIIMVLVHILNTGPVIGGFYYAMDPTGYTDKELREYHVREYPFIKDLVYLVPCGGFIMDETHKRALVFLGITLVTVLIHIIFAVTNMVKILINLWKSMKLKKSLTKKEAFQKQLITALVIQAMLPVLCLGIPYALITVEIVIKDETLAELSNFLLTVGSLHSFFHTVTLATVIKPYRKFIFRIKTKKVTPQPQNVSTQISQNLTQKSPRFSTSVI